MAFDFKTATPDSTFPATGYVFGGDSQSATDPSIYAASSVFGAFGFYTTTMSTSNTATQNGTALTADVIAAQGKPIVIPAGTYSYGGGSIGTAALDITSSEAAEVYLWFLSGAKLVCDTSGKNSTNVFFWFREGVVATIDGGDFDGGTIAEICARTTDVSATPGCELTVRNAKIHNFGWTTADSATASSAGTIGVLWNNSKRGVVDNCQFYNCRSKENGTYSDQPGKCTFIQWFNASSGQQNPFSYSITNCEFDAGIEANEADDFDAIHFLQQAPLASANGVIDNCRFKYHGKSRRVMKFQGGGTHMVTNCHTEPTSTWAAATTGATSIVITAATAATPGVFTTGSSHAIPYGTPAKLSAMAGGTWSTINSIEYLVVPASSTTFNLYGPATALDTSGLGTYTANTGTVKRTNGQGQTLTINAATAANPGVFTTRYGVVNNPHGFTTGEYVRFSSLAGGTWSTINDIDYAVVVLSDTTFSLQTLGTLDTSGLGTYTGSSGSITRVNGCSEEGHAGIDWAGANSGILTIDNCHLNLSGFRNGIVQSTGKGATIHTRNSTIIGNRYDANRFIPDSGANEVALPIGWSTNVDDVDSSLVNCDVYGWARSVFPAGKRNRIIGNRFHDPRVYWLQMGTTARDDLIVADNEIITRTAYSLDASTDATTVDFHRMAEFRNWTNMQVYGNRLTQAGNTLHGTRFISFISSGATGWAYDNIAPDAILTHLLASGANIKLGRPNLAGFTITGNVGGGTDDLQTLSIRGEVLNVASNAIKIVFSGATANNANAKTITLALGSATLGTLTATISQAANWVATAYVISQGASSQRYLCIMEEFGTVSQRVVSQGTATQSTIANTTITIKATGAATADNDITNNIAFVESASNYMLN